MQIYEKLYISLVPDLPRHEHEKWSESLVYSHIGTNRFGPWSRALSQQLQEGQDAHVSAMPKLVGDMISWLLTRTKHILVVEIVTTV